MTRTIPCMNHAGPDCRFCGGYGYHVFNTSNRYITQEAPTMPANTPATSDTELLDWAAAQTWSSFATDVAAKGKCFGLTDRQRSALESMRAKCAAKAAPAPTPAAGAPRGSKVEGFMSVVLLLGHIADSGAKWPSVWLSLKADENDVDEDRRLKIYMNMNGDYAGQLGLKLGQTMLGRIDHDGVWHPSQMARLLDKDTKAKLWLNVLKPLQEDARAVFAANGKKLGTCACCGRALSDQESVARGIGPECIKKLGGMF